MSSENLNHTVSNLENKKNQGIRNRGIRNRGILVALFLTFAIPVIIAYMAYFNGWFSAATKNFGELLKAEQVMDIEDYQFTRTDGATITGKEFETFYWWLMPIDPKLCNQQCLDLNTHLIKQTYFGLGKKQEKIKLLLALPDDSMLDAENFPVAYSKFSQSAVKFIGQVSQQKNSPQQNNLQKNAQDLPANFIYLVDPLGNIFMRYPLINDKQQAAKASKGLRTDILRLLKYSRLG